MSEATDLVVDRGAFELSGWASGPADSQTILCLHEGATSGAVWRRLSENLPGDARVAAYDRRGWGSSGAPPDYRRTTISEQAGDAEGVLDELAAEQAILCGAGIGAVIALELAVRRPELVAAAILIEPPLFALIPEATGPIGTDVEAIRRTTVESGARLGEDAEPSEAAVTGARAALELYLSGGLAVLGAGAERIPPDLRQSDGASPFALFAEVAAMSAWTLPLAQFPTLPMPVTVVVAGSTPPFVRRAAEALAPRLPGADLRELSAAGLPQLDGSAELAAALAELGSI